MALRLAPQLWEPQKILVFLRSLREGLEFKDKVNTEKRFLAGEQFADDTIDLPKDLPYCVVPDKPSVETSDILGAPPTTYRGLGLRQVFSIANHIGTLFLQPQQVEPYQDLYRLFFVILKAYGEQFNEQRRLLDTLIKNGVGEVPEAARDKLIVLLDELITLVEWYATPPPEDQRAPVVLPESTLPEWLRELDKLPLTGINKKEIDPYLVILKELVGYLLTQNPKDQVGVRLRPQLQEHVRVLPVRIFLNAFFPKLYQENAQKQSVFQIPFPEELTRGARPFTVSSVNAEAQGQLQAIFTLEDSEQITDEDLQGFNYTAKVVAAIEKFLEKPIPEQAYAGSAAAEDGGGGDEATQDLPANTEKQESIISLLTQADLSYGAVAGRMQAMLLPQFFRIHGFEDSFFDLVNLGGVDPAITEAYQQAIFQFQSELEHVLRNLSPEDLAALGKPEGRLKLLRSLYTRLSQNPKFIGQVLLIKEKYAEFRAAQAPTPDAAEKIRQETAKNIEENAARFLENAQADLQNHPDAKNERVWNINDIASLQAACEQAGLKLSSLQNLTTTDFETLIKHMGFDEKTTLQLTGVVDALVYVRISPEKVRNLTAQQFAELFGVAPPSDPTTLHQLCAVLAQYLLLRQERLNAFYQTNEYTLHDDELVTTSNLSPEEIRKARWVVDTAGERKISPLSFARAAHFTTNEASAVALSAKGHESAEETEVAHELILGRRAREYQRLIAEMEFADAVQREEREKYLQAVSGELGGVRGQFTQTSSGASVLHVDEATLRSILARSDETEFLSRSGGIEPSPAMMAALASGAGASPFLSTKHSTSRHQRLQALKNKYQQLKGLAELAKPGEIQRRSAKFAAQVLPATVAAAGAIGGAQAVIVTVSTTIGGAVGGALVGFAIAGPAGIIPGLLVGATAGGVTGLAAVTSSSGSTLPFTSGGSAAATLSAGPGATATAVATAHAPISSTALLTVVSTAGTLVGATGIAVVTRMATTGAFLPPLPTIGDNNQVSPYVTLEKTAVPPDGDAQQTYKTVPAYLKYTITVKANKGYRIKITNITDRAELKVNEKENTTRKASDPLPIPNPPPNFSQFINKEISPGEELKLAEYQMNFDNSYLNTNLNNNVVMTFTAFSPSDPSSASKTYTAETAESVCFGKCPGSEPGCWPTSGIITQLPYSQGLGSGSHAIPRLLKYPYNADAFDIAANVGTPVYTPFDGQACAGGIDIAYGNHVTVLTGGVSLLFAHMQTLYISGCQPVTAGTKLGVVGSTGNSSGPHLHYGIMPVGGSYASSNILKRVPDPAAKMRRGVRTCYSN